MRDIDFRVWNKTDKKIERVFSLNIFYNTVTTYEAKKYDNCDKEYDLMQYIGIKDCEGVKVFEEDMVEIAFKIDKPITGIVKFLEKEACFGVVTPDETFCFCEIDNFTLKVIGNTYEQ